MLRDQACFCCLSARNLSIELANLKLTAICEDNTFVSQQIFMEIQEKITQAKSECYLNLGICLWWGFRAPLKS